MPYPSLRFRLSQTDTWLLELYMALYTIVWGLGFANPLSDSFVTGALSYALLSLFPGGELAFGLAVTVLGSLKLYASLCGGRSVRALLFVLGGLFWLAIVVLVGIPTHWSAGGLPHFSLAAVANWYLWTRLRYRGPI